MRNYHEHKKHAEKAGLSTPCAAHHVSFGGGCLNCGYEPTGSLNPSWSEEASAYETIPEDACVVLILAEDDEPMTVRIVRNQGNGRYIAAVPWGATDCADRLYLCGNGEGLLGREGGAICCGVAEWHVLPEDK